MTSKYTSFCVILKPDAVKRRLVGKIFSRFEKRGFEILKVRMIDPDEDYLSLLHEHYASHNSKSYFSGLIDFMMSGRVIVMEITGDISVARSIVGESTVPHKFPPGSIRGDYACSIPENLIHCSENVESAQREVDIWFHNAL